MKMNMLRGFAVAFAAGLIALPLVSKPGYGQAAADAAARPRRARGGADNRPAGPTPRLPDGEPDIRGYWGARPGGDTYDLEARGSRPDYLLQGNSNTPRPADKRIVDPPDGRIPYQPWAAAKALEIRQNVDSPLREEDIDTQARCFPNGPGRAMIHSGFQVLQTHGQVTFLSEAMDEYRVIPIGDQQHIGQGIKLWDGDSRGHWEGDTLVIDITNLRAKSRLDMVGNFYSSNAHWIERYKVVDSNTILYEATIIDPTVYTKPWKLTIRLVRNHADDPEYEQWEYACHEGERSSSRMVIPADVEKKNEALAAKAAKAKAVEQPAGTEKGPR